MSPAPPTDTATWGARFGWIVGGIAGLVLGFACTFLLETEVLRARVRDPGAVATKLSSVVVPLLFLAGALGGYSFGAKAASTRYKALGVAAGFSIAALGWALLVLTR